MLSAGLIIMTIAELINTVNQYWVAASTMYMCCFLMQCIDDRYTLSYETHFRKYAVQYYAFFVFTEERLNYTTVQAGFFQNQKANTDLKN